MDNRTLTFDLRTPVGPNVFADTVRALNEAGVPFTLEQHGLFIKLTVGEGY